MSGYQRHHSNLLSPLSLSQCYDPLLLCWAASAPSGGADQKLPRLLFGGAFFASGGILEVPSGHTGGEVIAMAYVDPSIRGKFDSMPPDLQEHILKMDVRLESMSDLMACLEQIVGRQERPR